jgi:hypothetical protein
VTENNRLMAIFPWCVLQANAMIIGYAPSWIFESHLEMVKFHVAIHEYFQKLPSSRFTTSNSIGCYFITIGCWGIST